MYPIILPLPLLQLGKLTSPPVAWSLAELSREPQPEKTSKKTAASAGDICYNPPPSGASEACEAFNFASSYDCIICL